MAIRQHYIVYRYSAGRLEPTGCCSHWYFAGLPLALMWGTFDLDIFHWGDTFLKRSLNLCALILTSLVLSLSGSFANSDAVVYRWKDEAGNQVNSDRPPPQGIDYEVVSTRSSFVRPVDSKEGAVPLEVNSSAGNDAKKVAAKTPATQKNPEYCAAARNNLLQIDSHARIQLRDDQGEVRYLSEEEKAVEKQKALAAIKAFCD